MPRLQAAFRTLLADNERGMMKRLGYDPEMLSIFIFGFFLHLARCEPGARSIDRLAALEGFATGLGLSHIAPEELFEVLNEDFLGDNLQYLAQGLQSSERRQDDRFYEKSIRFNMQSTRYFETKAGYMVLRPKWAQSSDQIFGACFVLGLMDGEDITRLETGEAILEDITIQ
ncbi:hypothetical protein F5Y19DRAFT_431480 [Xylariaceae sp. FL1651]|nr:hypothetical protein F5Y19DRAFT_431480 [Xylariaceae sp. FL1651]